MEKFIPQRWQPNRQSEDDSQSHEGLLNGAANSDRHSETQTRWFTVRLVIVTAVNITICLLTIAIVRLLVRPVSHAGLQDSLILDEVNLESWLKPGNKSRWSFNEADSIFLQPPSPEVDAAWDAASLEGYELTTISGDEARALGRDVQIMSKVPESWGLGSDRYFAQIHVFHLIHCLDEVRKQMHYDHYHQPKYGNSPPQTFVNHKNHCLHMLLENLLCQSNSDIVVHNWRETYHVPLADFNPPRQCRNFDALSEWGKKHAIVGYKTRWSKLEVPSDAVVLPAPTPRLY